MTRSASHARSVLLCAVSRAGVGAGCLAAPRLRAVSSQAGLTGHRVLFQMGRLLRACAQHQIRQSKSRKEIFTQDCSTKCIIVTYMRMAAGDYCKQLIAPTIRALQGPWTANEAGLKGDPYGSYPVHSCVRNARNHCGCSGNAI